jgi:hypothetical protein
MKHFYLMSALIITAILAVYNYTRLNEAKMRLSLVEEIQMEEALERDRTTTEEQRQEDIQRERRRLAEFEEVPPPQTQAPPREAEQKVVVVTNFSAIEESGCWVTIYDEPHFSGRSITIFNGIDLPVLQLPDGTNWHGHIRSVQVGPRARLFLYGLPDFQDRELVVAPGRSLDGRVALPWAQISSLRTNCTP